MLAANEETILYVSSHGPFEKGKDIVTRTATGEIRAYQLKKGDIGLTEWRSIYGEIVNLVELPIEFAGNPPITDFVPYIVTNGELTDPVIEQVRAANISWQSRGIGKTLHIIEKGQLFDSFRNAHGAYMPKELVDFRTFLELILREGAAPADKEKAARLIEDILPAEPELASVLNISRAATSIALLTAYITGPAALALNHWSVFEYWVLAGAYILHLIEKSKMAEAECQVSFEICELAAEGALVAIAEESKDRTDLVQGFPLADSHVYRTRVTILIGLLSALDLSLRIRQKPRGHSDFVKSFLDERLKESLCWGESAVPFFFLGMLFAEQNCNSPVAEGLAIQLIKDFSSLNGESGHGRGTSNPYYSPEESLRVIYGLDSLNDEMFIGLSYSIAPLVDFLARRWRRRALAFLWFGITRMNLVDYVPANAAEWFRWRSSDGFLNSRLAGEPQSWEALRNNARNLSLEALPPTLVRRPAFALWYLLVYPHRFTPATAKLIDDAVMAAEG